MKEITIKAPEGFEFVSDKPVYIKPLQWYAIMETNGDIVACQYKTTGKHYLLRETWIPKKDEPVSVRLKSDDKEVAICRYSREGEDSFMLKYADDASDIPWLKSHVYLKPITQEGSE